MFDEIVRYGVVAVIPQSERSDSNSVKYLMIERSSQVIAPGRLCFPGGGIEPGETPEAAIIRECQEELLINIEPIRPIWENVTPWHVHLRWFLARLPRPELPVINEKEVAAYSWMTLSELLNDPRCLESNRPFLQLAIDGKINL